MRALFFFLAISLIWLPSLALAAQPQRPVVIIPGILGSKLCDSEGKTVWGNVDSLFRFPELKLPFKINHSALNHKPCGLIETIQILGPFQLHQYNGLIDYLVAQGYVRDKTLYTFPYDWRLSNYHTAQKFADYIEKLFPDKKKKIDIIAHSMGGFIARIYIQKLGGSERVHNLLFLGTPHRGSANVFKTLDQGWGFWKNLAAGGLGSVREVMLTFPSVYQLLPSYQNCCGWQNDNTGELQRYFKSTDKKAWKDFGWLPVQFKSGEGRDALHNMLKDASKLQDLMRGSLPDDVRTFNIVTGLLDTQWKTFFASQSGDFSGTKNYPGDGTVIEWSAANGTPSEARPSTAEHGTIFNGDAPRQAIRWLLGTDAEPKKGIPLDYRAVLRDAANHDFKLISIFYETEPSVSAPGAPTEFKLRLSGETALADADLRNVALRLRDQEGDRPLSITIKDAVKIGAIAQREIAATFASPSKPGLHSVSVTIPGVGTFSDMVFVLKKKP